MILYRIEAGGGYSGNSPRPGSKIPVLPTRRLVLILSLLHNGIHIVSRFKENPVSNETASNKIPEEALNAFLDGILAELKSPPDPAMLTKVRAIFRKRIPLHMRSYAAALLILRAAGVTRIQPQKPAGSLASEKQRPIPSSRPNLVAASEPGVARGQAPAANGGEPMVPLFVSMGKRQRLRPQELRTFISEKTGIPSEELGRVHLFDNYSFIDIPEPHTEKIIATVDGSSFKGRTLEIKPAKKKSEQPQEKDPNE
jgi:hypothetical protein